jgi:hypothetical protein
VTTTLKTTSRVATLTTGWTESADGEADCCAKATEKASRQNIPKSVTKVRGTVCRQFGRKGKRGAKRFLGETQRIILRTEWGVAKEHAPTNLTRQESNRQSVEIQEVL